MIPLESAIYEGTVRHRRFEPVGREFNYRIFMLYLDLDEIPTVMKVHPLFSTRRRSPARFRRADYLGPSNLPLKTAVLDLVQQRTGIRPSGPVRMLTHLRYWGMIENPVTIYYCFDPSGETVETVVAEVTNTPWGDRHAYVIESEPGTSLVSGKKDKQLHVSPLMPMDHEYNLSFARPGKRLPVHISSGQGSRTIFDATLNLARTEISRRTFSRLLVAYPPMSFRVAAGIHWQAALTWLRGVRYHPRPDSETESGTLRSSPKIANMCPVHGDAAEISSRPTESVI